VKRIIAILCLASLTARGQVPTPAPPVPSPYPNAIPTPAPTPAAPAQAIPNIGTRSTPHVLPPRSTNSIFTPMADGTAPSIARPVSGAPVPAAQGIRPVPGAQPNLAPPPPLTTEPGTPAVAITPPPSAGNPAAAPDILPAGMIDFRGATLDDVLKLYAELVNRTILRPANLAAQQQVVLKTQTDLTRKEAIQALDAVLALNGVAMINVGEKFAKAVLLATANQEGQAFSKLDPSSLPDMGQYTTHVVQLRYAKPSELVQALQPFAKAPNPILPIDSSQILVLRDFTENVKRMLELIKEIDVAVPSEFIQEVVPIKYALASEISSALNSLGSGSGGATVGGTGTSGGATTTGSRTGSSFGRSGSSTSRGGFGNSMNQGAYGMNNPMGGATGATGQPSTFGDRLQQIMRRASVTGDIQVIGSTKIIADERTNSLLIFASREDMKVIKEIISKLDVVLAQVLIEAVIIEVNLGDDKALGISYLQHPQKSGNFTGVGAINNKTFSQISDYVVGTSGTNGSSGSMPSGLSYLGSFGQDLDVSLTAVASDNRSKILQRPYIQTSHAVPATLFVGESRPYPMGSYYGGGSYGSYSSIQQIQIGVTLEVTPLINPDGLVVMDIHQKIESANGSVNIANVGDVPVTSQKDAVAKVAVRDRDTIMLGGLIETSKSKTASGVPYLKDIPVLGYLFRSSTSKEIRNEMIVLIRPTVLPTPEIAALTARSEKAKMPGIRQAETELEKDQSDRIKKLEKEEKASRPAKGENDPRFAPVEGL